MIGVSVASKLCESSGTRRPSSTERVSCRAVTCALKSSAEAVVCESMSAPSRSPVRRPLSLLICERAVTFLRGASISRSATESEESEGKERRHTGRARRVRERSEDSGCATRVLFLVGTSLPHNLQLLECRSVLEGGDGVWDHVNSCLHHAWTCAHDHVLRSLESVGSTAGFATNHKRVLTSAGNRRADLEIRNILVAQSPCDMISSAPVTLGRIKASSATPTTRITSSRAPPTRSATIVSCRRACLPLAASAASSCA